MAEVTITVDTDDVKHLLASAYAFGVEEAIEVAKKVEAQLPWEPHYVAIRALQEAMHWPVETKPISDHGDPNYYYGEAVRILVAMHKDGVEFTINENSPMLPKMPKAKTAKEIQAEVIDLIPRSRINHPATRVPRAPKGPYFDQ